jgi:hypothetical protein
MRNLKEKGRPGRSMSVRNPTIDRPIQIVRSYLDSYVTAILALSV